MVSLCWSANGSVSFQETFTAIILRHNLSGSRHYLLSSHYHDLHDGHSSFVVIVRHNLHPLE